MIAQRTPPGPAFDEYCEWLEGKGGRVEHKQNRWGRYSLLHSPDNRLCVPVPETLVNTMLVSQMIEYLDLRLGLTSPYRNSDDDADAEG